MEQLVDNMGAVKFALTAEQMTKLSALSCPAIPYPYEMVWRCQRVDASGRLDGNLWPRKESSRPEGK